MDSLTAALQATSISSAFPVLIVSSLEELEAAKNVLADCKLLAFDCEGVDLGRSGKVCLVQLSTREKCFLFDVLDKPMNDAIVLYLKSLLEDDTIVKVIHDCKMDSDALFHLCDIRVCNCHDTQVWDQTIRSLSSGLRLNQTLRENGCEANVERDSSVYQRNFAFCATRPMTKQMIDWASGDVSSLFELYDKQIATATTSQSRRGKLGSKANEDYLRGCVDKVAHVRNLGRLIGPGGSNLRNLMDRVPGCLIQQEGPRGTGVVRVYAPDNAKLARIMGLVKQYQSSRGHLELEMLEIINWDALEPVIMLGTVAMRLIVWWANINDYRRFNGCPAECIATTYPQFLICDESSAFEERLTGDSLFFIICTIFTDSFTTIRSIYYFYHFTSLNFNAIQYMNKLKMLLSQIASKIEKIQILRAMCDESKISHLQHKANEGCNFVVYCKNAAVDDDNVSHFDKLYENAVSGVSISS